MHPAQVQRHAGILTLLENGLVLDALALEEMSFADAERAKSDGAASGLDETVLGQRIDEFVAAALRRAKEAHTNADPKPTTHSFDARRRAVATFFKKVPLQKCDNCHCFAVSLRREGGAKVFRAKLSAKHQRANDEMGARTTTAELFEGASKRKRAHGGKAKGTDDGVEDDAVMEEEEEHEEPEEVDDDEESIEALTDAAFGEANGIQAMETAAATNAPTGSSLISRPFTGHRSPVSPSAHTCMHARRQGRARFHDGDRGPGALPTLVAEREADAQPALWHAAPRPARYRARVRGRSRKIRASPCMTFFRACVCARASAPCAPRKRLSQLLL